MWEKATKPDLKGMPRMWRDVVASLNFTKLVHNVSRVERNVNKSSVTILSFKPLSLFSHGTLRLTLVAHFEIIESFRNPYSAPK